MKRSATSYRYNVKFSKWWDIEAEEHFRGSVYQLWADSNACVALDSGLGKDLDFWRQQVMSSHSPGTL